jgi:hypothetical protein
MTFTDRVGRCSKSLRRANAGGFIIFVKITWQNTFNCRSGYSDLHSLILKIIFKKGDNKISDLGCQAFFVSHLYGIFKFSFHSCRQQRLSSFLEKEYSLQSEI